ncbi:MAG TPA: flavodoxin-dependent (E)-4-hydroxy-3-methylbut-2-enyl-diphosphate synthase [Clostridia bacterium]|nr:flavodoxin-dependent (E)-4-hydroxy-3-methylbut-2-enyl-diphosphate synthase [Clostridia bacterium]
MQRRMSKKLKVGNAYIGGDAPITVQSMLSVPAENIDGSIKQAVELEAAGCQIIRAAVPSISDVGLILALKNKINVPIVADIHFDYRIALECVGAGVDKIRINPGNIGAQDRIKAVANACKSKNIPIRVGVNSGSVEKDILAKFGGPSAEALAESAMYHVSLLEKFDFDDIIISIKSSDVETMIKAYKIAAEKCDYPLHLGVTEAGTYKIGLIKSSVGIGSLLLDGVGDTIRVSLTDDPVKEVEVGYDILRALNVIDGVQIVSCPTCGRTKIDLMALVKEVENRLKDCNKNIKVAVMGCAVNGPGEAREADIGIAGGDGCALIFKKGEVLRKVPEDRVLEELIKEIELL